MVAPRRKQTRVLEHLLKGVQISKGDRADGILEGDPVGSARQKRLCDLVRCIPKSHPIEELEWGGCAGKEVW